MRQHARNLAVVVGAAAAVVGLGACGALPSRTFEDDPAVTGTVTSVRIDNRAGAVVVRGVAGATAVTVHRKVEHAGEPPEGPTSRVEDGALVLGDCGRHCSVSYTVELPAGLPVTGETSSGAIRLSGVGAVRVSTSSGRIELDGVTGSADVRTSNGRITGRNLSGARTRAETSNGAIDLRPSTAQSIHAETSNGEITLVVPAAPYRVSARTDSGDTRIATPNDPAGKHQLDLLTSNGDITVTVAG